MITQDLLVKISKQGLSVTSQDQMTKLACAYWHEDFLPDVDHVLQLGREQRRMIGYLTEFFSMYHCVEESQAMKLVEVAHHIKSGLNPTHNKNNPDDIAAEWGMTENMTKFLSDLLYHQTRHYKHIVQSV